MPTEVKSELQTEPALPRSIDYGAIVAKRRERAVGEDAQRARVMAQPIDRNGARDIGALSAEERLALLGFTKDELRSLLAGEDTANG